jgi:hypothetical protein
MQDHMRQKLTSTEIGNLWNSYMLDEMAIRMFKHIISNAEDQEIKEVFQYTHDVVMTHVGMYQNLFKKEQMAVHGFSEDELDLSAPRLFSDIFFIYYLKHMSKFALQMFSSSYLSASREDIRDLFATLIDDAKEIDQRTTELLKDKGLNIEPPSIPIPKTVDFVKKQSFLAGFFGEQRPLMAQEITYLFQNAQSNAYGKALLMGFSQVAQSKEVQQFFIRGQEIAHKHATIFSDILLKEDLSVPNHFDEEVSVSTKPPFSDRYMMVHANFLIQGGLGNYGMAMSSAQRRDLALVYERLIAEVGLFAEDGANILINNGWMEQPPLAPKRKEFSNSSE